MVKNFHVYIMASHKNGTLYIGMTSDLAGRVFDHKESRLKGFTQRHNVKRLVYYEACEDANEAIEREKFLKKQRRDYKIRMIERDNPEWYDLYGDMRYLSY
ncbi:GIY-YIG nuclease family protein [Fretibacter rubidus]|uniref:GIY-YIG nuclease family protein n=1 Tax=Fretibacter rubidus TaxID=570162 RepID=UPI00352B954A